MDGQRTDFTLECHGLTQTEEWYFLTMSQIQEMEIQAEQIRAKHGTPPAIDPNGYSQYGIYTVHLLAKQLVLIL